MIWAKGSVAYWDYNLECTSKHRALVNVNNPTKYYMCSVRMIMVIKWNANIFALCPPVFIIYGIPLCVRVYVILYRYIHYNIIYHYNTSVDPFHFLASTYIVYIYVYSSLHINNRTSAVRTIEIMCVVGMCTKKRGPRGYYIGWRQNTHTAVICEGHRYIFYTCCVLFESGKKSRPEIKLLSSIIW